ncbi:phage tail protein I [Acidaminococcus sp.]|uniref:phage tail protein I n=1 Tax=Acidaminococcus sp. TaxID=1872103 RepID=UPI003D7DE23F
MSKLKDFDLKLVLPSSISGDKGVKETADAVSEALNAVTDLIPMELVYSRIDSLPEDILDILARQFHVDDYDDTANIETKRSQVRSAIAIHRYKGTVYAVRQVVDNLAGGAKVKEWPEYNGQPYHFRVEGMPDEVRNGTAVDNLTRAIDNAKNVRSWLDELIWYRELSMVKRHAIATAVHKDINISLPTLLPVSVVQTKRFIMATQVFKEIWIGGKNG